MLETNAVFHRKENDLAPSKCVVEKIVWLEKDVYEDFSKNMLKDFDFIEENKDLQYRDENGVYHCLLVASKDGNDAILVESEGYGYARYSAFISNAKKWIEATEQTQTVKFYSPLFGKIIDNDCEDYDSDYWYDDIDSAELVKYQAQILLEINNSHLHSEGRKGLMTYWDNDNDMPFKVLSAFPTVEVRNGSLMGVMEMKVIGELTHDDIEKLKAEWTGQYSDGWGEGFEQKQIHTSQGELMVSFWDCNNYYIHTEQEQNDYVENQNHGQSQGMSM